jgi:dienelactone hydrolase
MRGRWSPPFAARRFLAGVVAGLAVAALVVSAVPVAASAATHRAPYAIGLHWYTFVDPSRPTPPNGSYPGAPTRTLPTLLIYPAEGDPAGPAAQNAPPVEHGKGFPLLVFSHGSGGDSTSRLADLTERLVRAGFVVAAPTFPLSSAGAPGGTTSADYVNQPGDVKFVITQVLNLARDDHHLGKTIDRHRIGVIGNSLGAVTTLGVAANSCCLDPRIDAAVALWGGEAPFPGGSFFSGPTPPLMLAHGTADARLPYVLSVIAYGHALSPKAFLTLEGAPHNPFFPPWHEPTIRSVVDFLDGFLDHDPQAIRRLPRDGNVPDVASLQEDVSTCHWCR